MLNESKNYTIKDLLNKGVTDEELFNMFQKELTSAKEEIDKENAAQKAKEDHQKKVDAARDELAKATYNYAITLGDNTVSGSVNLSNEEALKLCEELSADLKKFESLFEKPLTKFFKRPEDIAASIPEKDLDKMISDFVDKLF